MAKGRKKLPTAVKAAKGTLQACRENPDEPNYITLHELPDPPKYLNKIGKAEYYSAANELQHLGILNNVNFNLFVAYCTQVAVYFDAIERLHESGSVIVDASENPKVNPFMRVANDSLANMIRIACEFGITPASASKVNANKKTDNKMDLLKSLKQ